MRAWLDGDLLFVHGEDVPPYKKGGSIVRNSYFWALKSIAAFTPRSGAWEFDQPVWIALSRLLLSFSQSGYLGLSETYLEFTPGEIIPVELRDCSTLSTPE